MATLKNVLWIGFILLVVALSILFSLQNSTPIALDLLIAPMPPLPVSVWILLSFALGAVFGLGAGGLSVLKLRSANHLLRRKLQQIEAASAKNGAVKAAAGH